MNCCKTMDQYLNHKCDEHDDPHECTDYVIAQFGDKIGIPIRDGGSSFSEIKFCPWCGNSILPFLNPPQKQNKDKLKWLS